MQNLWRECTIEFKYKYLWQYYFLLGSSLQMQIYNPCKLFMDAHVSNMTPWHQIHVFNGQYNHIYPALLLLTAYLDINSYLLHHTQDKGKESTMSTPHSYLEFHSQIKACNHSWQLVSPKINSIATLAMPYGDGLIGEDELWRRDLLVQFFSKYFKWSLTKIHCHCAHVILWGYLFHCLFQ